LSYLDEYISVDDEIDFRIQNKVVQEQENKFEGSEQTPSLAELEAFQNLIFELMDFYGIYYSKHNKYNLIVKIEGNNDEKE